MKQFSLFIIVSLFLPMVVLAAFNDVSLTTGATLRLTVGGTTVDLTVTNGTLETVNVYGGSLDIGLAAGSSVDLTSASRYTFNYTASRATASFTCGSSSSTLGFALAGGQASETVSVTPNTTVCVAAGSTGGSGGTTTPAPTPSPAPAPAPVTSAGATPSASPAPAPAPKPVTPAPAPKSVAVAPAPVPTPVPMVVAPAAPVLIKELNPGTRSDDVVALQELLAQDPEIYPEGIVSGFYGPKTTAAVRKFQAKYGLPAVGRVGQATLAKLNEVFGETAMAVQPSAPSVQSQTADQIQSQIQAIQKQIQAIISGAPAPVAPSMAGVVTVDTELNPGARNNEVMDLQKILAQDPEIYPEGVVSGFYGPKTTAAVRKFQAKYGLPAVGRVGPATLQKLNEVFSGESSVPVTPESPSSAAPPVPVTTSAVDVLTKQIEAQIKTIQAQIKALQR